MTEISAQEKLACAERELRMRRDVYPRLVARGKMRRAEAEREIEIMAAIAEDYRRQTDLFGRG